VHDTIRLIAVKHHEKLNGSGYPKQLSGNDITFFDQIVAIADILSALSSERSYKAAYPKEKIIGILNDMSEQKHFDPKIIKLAIDHFDEIMEAVNRVSVPVLQAYNDMNEEYLWKRDTLRNKFKSHLFSSI
jgi:HD-GYP domain-containing protein (c-di-GMP phosphodiesterase class II)